MCSRWPRDGEWGKADESTTGKAGKRAAGGRGADEGRTRAVRLRRALDGAGSTSPEARRIGPGGGTPGVCGCPWSRQGPWRALISRWGRPPVAFSATPSPPKYCVQGTTAQSAALLDSSGPTTRVGPTTFPASQPFPPPRLASQQPLRHQGVAGRCCPFLRHAIPAAGATGAAGAMNR